MSNRFNKKANWPVRNIVVKLMAHTLSIETHRGLHDITLEDRIDEQIYDKVFRPLYDEYIGRPNG